MTVPRNLNICGMGLRVGCMVPRRRFPAVWRLLHGVNLADVKTKEATVYSSLTGCKVLQFEARFSFGPGAASEEGTTQADTPSAYTVNAEVPQTSSSLNWRRQM